MKNLKLLAALMSPAYWLALLLAALVLIGAGGAVGYRVASAIGEAALFKAKGERDADRAAYAIERAQAVQKLAAEQAKVAAIEKQRKDDLRDVAETHKQEMKDAKVQIDSLRADVRAGAVRLSIAVKPPAPASSCAAGGNTAPAPGPGEEARAELVPEAAETLIDIAADGDDAVRDFNACHDAYESLRQKVRVNP